MSKLIENLIKNYSAQSIERKDISLKDLVNNEGELINDAQTIEVELTGMSSKFVPKYASETNCGYITMLYLKDGRKVGAFSNALYDFAKYFYKNAGFDIEANFNRLDFNGNLKVTISVVALGGGKSTYNFNIVDGDFTGFTGIDGGETLLLN